MNLLFKLVPNTTSQREQMSITVSLSQIHACKMPHGVPRLFLVLFVVSLNRVATSSATSSYSKVARTVSKLREASTQGEDEIAHYCGYQSIEATYYGAIATMDVYAFPNLKKGEKVGAQFWVSDCKTQNQISSGWEVNPKQYGDSKPHFFVYWAKTNLEDGCANFDCAGFVPVNLTTITPGDTLEPTNGHMSITLKIFKIKEDGNWWLYFGHDSDNLNSVGYWPESLLINMEDHAGVIEWGGATFSHNGENSPPMGNGQWPGSNSAASFRNVQYVDVDGQGYDPPGDSLHVMETRRKCYQTGVFQLEVQGNMFYYGGPGGCTS